jgi:hypothetical protein
MTPRQLLVLIALVLSLFSSTALASKLQVIPFTGPKKQELTKRASTALEKGGNRLVKSGTTPDPNNPESLTKAGKLSGADAFVIGMTQQQAKRWELIVAVHAGKDGGFLGEFTLSAAWFPGLLKEIDTKLASKVASTLGKDAKAEPEEATGKAKPEEEDKDEEDEDEDEAEPEEKEDAGKAEPSEDESEDEVPRPSPLFVALQFGSALRNFTPKDAIFPDRILSQENQSLLGPRLMFGLYPAAFFSSGTLANLGIRGYFEKSIIGQTEVPAHGVAPNVVAAGSAGMSEQDYWFALHFRVPAGEHYFGFGAGPGKHTMETEITPAYFIPDISYSYFRFGVDSQFKLGNLGLGLNAAYRPVSSLSDAPGHVRAPYWFPKAEADGMELGVHIGYSLSESLAILLSGDYRRYGFNFHRVPADLNPPLPPGTTEKGVPVAGGATDTYLGFWAGIGYTLGH